MAKGMSSAYVPMAAATVTEEIAEYFEDTHLSHGHTYAGHPVGCAAALAAIETYREENLIERAQELGTYISQKLNTLGEKHPSVGDVRGIGMLQGLELTKHPEKRVPFGTRNDMISDGTTVLDEVKKEAKSRGLYVLGVINTLVIAPAFTISKDEIDEGIEILDAALEVSDNAMEKST
jgi:taurine--2-oxoglutarate transaminase